MSPPFCGFCYIFTAQRHVCSGECPTKTYFIENIQKIWSNKIEMLGKHGEFIELSHIEKNNPVIQQIKNDYLKEHPIENQDKNNNIAELFPRVTNEGIIMLRHVTDKTSDKFWRHGYDCIREFYPTENVLIIDDNSNYDFISEKELDKNTLVIRSEYPGRGEVLPYYYYSRIGNKFCNTALCIHDSMFITAHININEINKCKMLWSFSSHHPYERNNAYNILSVYHDSELNTLFGGITWKGCFGGMSIINHDYLLEINNKFNISLMLEVITTRPHREAFERVWGAILHFCENTQKVNNVLIGDIHEKGHWGKTWGQHNSMKTFPITKIWYSR